MAQPDVLEFDEHKLGATDFHNVDVYNAKNPSIHGAHVGPLHNENKGWKPQAIRDAEARNVKPPAMSQAMNVNHPKLGFQLSSINWNICPVVSSTSLGREVMCGRYFKDNMTLRRHIRDNHMGAMENRDRKNATIVEKTDALNTYKQYVVMGHWRNAEFANSPGYDPKTFLLEKLARACERMATNEPWFANLYGKLFSRHHNISNPGAVVKREDVTKPGVRPLLGGNVEQFESMEAVAADDPDFISTGVQHTPEAYREAMRRALNEQATAAKSNHTRLENQATQNPQGIHTSGPFPISTGSRSTATIPKRTSRSNTQNPLGARRNASRVEKNHKSKKPAAKGNKGKGKATESVDEDEDDGS